MMMHVNLIPCWSVYFIKHCWIGTFSLKFTILKVKNVQMYKEKIILNNRICILTWWTFLSFSTNVATTGSTFCILIFGFTSGLYFCISWPTSTTVLVYLQKKKTTSITNKYLSAWGWKYTMWDKTLLNARWRIS